MGNSSVQEVETDEGHERRFIVSGQSDPVEVLKLPGIPLAGSFADGFGTVVDICVRRYDADRMLVVVTHRDYNQEANSCDL